MLLFVDSLFTLNENTKKIDGKINQGRNTNTGSTKRLPNSDAVMEVNIGTRF